jgi:hypothetical protein
MFIVSVCVSYSFCKQSSWMKKMPKASNVSIAQGDAETGDLGAF